MKKQQMANRKPPKKALTLADLTVSYKVWDGPLSGVKEKSISPEDLALALEYVHRVDAGNLLRDAAEANSRLVAAEHLVLAIAHTQENGDEVGSEAFWAVRGLIQEGRVRYELHCTSPKPEDFLVTIGKPSAMAGGQR